MLIFRRGVLVAGVSGLVLALVVACGGGGGGGGFVAVDRAGLTGGTINGFGSVIVNGVEYDTDDADFDIDDNSGTQAGLRVGQQVTVQWDSTDDGDTRRAQVVHYDDTVEGPISSIDVANQVLVVLGQVIIVDGATSFDDEIFPRDLTGLAEDDVVEISGLVDGNGAVHATRIDYSENADDFEVRGVVSSFDFATSTFVINSLTVDYSDLLNPPTLANGLLVEVEGDTFAAGTLVANKVEVLDDDIAGVEDGDDGEIEGYITSFTSATNFSVSGLPVTTNGQTIYEDGVAGDLDENIKVEVEGEVNGAGVLVARRVEFKSGDSDGDGDDDAIDGKVEGDVTAVSSAAGTLLVAGVTVTVTTATRFQDQTGVAGQSFGLGAVAVGDFVKVRGAPGTGATLAALILERDEANDEGRLRGPAGSIDAGAQELSVLGVGVSTDGSTQYRDADDDVISAGAFFAAISNGSEVEVRFTQGGPGIVADQLELEDADD